MEFVYGNKHRIFINTSIGCAAKCSYCYLPSLGANETPIGISANDAIEMVENNALYVPGEDGTVLSIGCYSECLDDENAPKTKKILERFMSYGNYIQLATKQKISQNIIDTIVQQRKFSNQVIIYISMPTITAIEKVETGTALFDVRLNNIERCINSGIPVVLYIKPFIEGMTDSDLDMYRYYFATRNIPVVIGGLLSQKETPILSEVGNKQLFEQSIGNSYKIFFESMKSEFQCFEHSTDLIEYYKDRYLEDSK